MKCPPKLCKLLFRKDKYKVPGQNIGILAVWKTYPSNTDAISKTMDGWFSENEKSDMSSIDKYHDE